MWYLIVPPVIVVLTFSFLLWYLSRKSSDSVVSERLSRFSGQGSEEISFRKTKEFSLRVLEKLVQRFKVVSLRMHNSLSDWTQSIKAKRRRVEEKAPQVVEETDARVAEEPIEVIHESVAAPVVETQESVAVKIATRNRPMVSEKVTQPEVKRRTVRSAAREESLILRIAENPKDYAAYEELGDHYLDLGNIKDAKECYRQVLKLSPVQRMVKIKIRRLEKIIAEQEPLIRKEKEKTVQLPQ